MSQGRSAFPNDPETLVTLVESQAALIAKLQHELEQLKFAYGKLLKERFGPKSEKLAAGQLALFDLPEESPPPSVPISEDEDLEPETKRRRGGRRKLPGTPSTRCLPASEPSRQRRTRTGRRRCWWTKRSIGWPPASGRKRPRPRRR